jgi:hypothetical protein
VELGSSLATGAGVVVVARCRGAGNGRRVNGRIETRGREVDLTGASVLVDGMLACRDKVIRGHAITQAVSVLKSFILIYFTMKILSVYQNLLIISLLYIYLL